jgi:flagellar basal body P-ring protein FlgI
VERSVPTPLLEGDSVQLGLMAADFNTARAVARAINEAKGEGTAAARDGRSITLRVPADPNARISFLADVENLPVELGRACRPAWWSTRAPARWCSTRPSPSALARWPTAACR